MSTNDGGTGALFAQILAELKSISAEVSALKVANAEVVAEAKARQKQVEDHESRLRVLEAVEVVTSADLEAATERRAKRTAWLVGIALAVLTPIEAALIALWLK